MTEGNPAIQLFSVTQDTQSCDIRIHPDDSMSARLLNEILVGSAEEHFPIVVSLWQSSGKVEKFCCVL
jgi:hypothetical protein